MVLHLSSDSSSSCSSGLPCLFIHIFFFPPQYLFIWLHWVLVAALGIFYFFVTLWIFSCGI